MNTLLLDALQCRNRGRPPIWLMRQAGRYMPEYRALREKHSFLEMCHQPELIAEVTQLPVRVFGMDAAILFSDILVIPEALGLGLRFEEGAGPLFERPITSPQDIDKLPEIKVEESLKYVAQGIKMVKPHLNVPLIGFCGAPFTVASYMIEGKTNRELRKTKMWMMQDPKSFHLLLNKLSDLSIEYLHMQINAGVQAVQIFDSWASVLGYSHFKEFSLAYMKKIVEAIKGKVPVILFCRGSSTFAPELAKVGPSAISLDWNANMASMRPLIPPTVALQGNLDPDILYAPVSVLRKEVTKLLHTMHGDPGYIFNLGHGIHPDVTVSNVKALVECVQSIK